MTSSLLVKLTISACLCCCAFWQARAQSRPALGDVVELKEPCKKGPGEIPNTSCQTLKVSCPGVRPLQVQIRITEPAAGVPFRGTVVVGSGRGGSGFYAGLDNSAGIGKNRIDALEAAHGGATLVQEVAAMGFRVVDRAWEGENGWTTSEAGFVKESCRYATLLTWIHDHIHKQGKFVATGNSGGSAEISYALTTWGRGDILDVAIPSSGPPLGRLDLACVKQPSPEWASLCASIVPKGVMECTPVCVLGTSGVCQETGPNPTPQQLLEDSVVHPGAVLNYPKTKVYFLYGAHDCGGHGPSGEPVTIGLTYANKVTSQKVIRFVPHTPHALFSTPEGRAAIEKAINEGTADASESSKPRSAK